MRKDLRLLVSALAMHSVLAGVAGCSGQPLTVANDGGSAGSSGSSTSGGGSGSSTSGGGGSGKTMSGAEGGGSGVSMSGGGGGSGAATSGGQGGAGSSTSGTGGSGSATSGTGGSGSAASGTGGSGSAASGTGGEIDAGGGDTCSVTKACTGGDVCGFPRVPVCGTEGQCFKRQQVECLVYQAGCACDGTEISVACNGLPAGYDTKPLRHTGVCIHGE